MCHTFLNPVKKNGHVALIEEGEFIHPLALEGSHVELGCNRCHTGGISPDPTCAGCHAEQAAFRAGTLAALEPFGITADPMAETVDCEGCHDLSQPTTLEAIDALCMECHEDEEERFEGMLPYWKREIDELLLDVQLRVDESGRQVLEQLRRAGPLHNVEATRSIVRMLRETRNEPIRPPTTEE